MRLQNRRVLGSAGLTALVMGAALVLTGCGAGQITQTDTEQAAINGANAHVKALDIRNAVLEFPPSGAYAAGSDAPLRLTIVNSGPNDDALVQVSSDAASGAVISGSKVIVAGSSLVVTPPTPGASVTSSPSSSAPQSTNSSQATSSASTSSTSSPSTTPSSPTSSSSAVATTSQAAPPVAVGQASIVLTKLNKPVWPGQTIKVTFVFRDAGPVTVDVPLGTSDSPRSGDVHTEAAGSMSSGH